MKKNLVNIITPSYNSAHLIPRLLDSILKQTYPHISMFVIDDGSTDNTKGIIDRYIPLFANKGYLLHYVYQSNGGQSSAINNGLKFVTGEFMTWPDSDDWYKTDDAIEKMVNTFSQYSNVEIARCQMEYISEQDSSTIRTTSLKPCNSPCDILEEAIYQINDFFYAPIGWMVRTRYLEKFIPNREIYVHKYAGQNAQMLLPYLVNSQCVTSNEVLACYMVSKASSSHRLRPYEEQFSYFDEHLKAFIVPLSTIKNLSPQKRNQFIHFRKEFYYPHFLETDYIYSKTQEFNKHYRESQELGIKVDEKYNKLYRWTRVMSLSSYKFIQSFKRVVCKVYKKCQLH